MRFEEYRQAENRRIWVSEKPFRLPVTGASTDVFEDYGTEQANIADFREADS